MQKRLHIYEKVSSKEKYDFGFIEKREFKIVA